MDARTSAGCEEVWLRYAHTSQCPTGVLSTLNRNHPLSELLAQSRYTQLHPGYISYTSAVASLTGAPQDLTHSHQ